MQQQANYLQQLLVSLRTRLLVMCASVGIALEDAGKAMAAGDPGRAASVIENDAAIDALENEIDEMALQLLARTQPVARDLRFVVSALRMVVDLERIGDEDFWVAQARRASVLLDSPGFSAVFVATNGTMARMNTVHPATFVAFKRWMAGQPDRDALKRRRDVLQADAVQVLLEQYLPQV